MTTKIRTIIITIIALASFATATIAQSAAQAALTSTDGIAGVSIAGASTGNQALKECLNKMIQRNSNENTLATMEPLAARFGTANEQSPERPRDRSQLVRCGCRTGPAASG